MIDQRNPTSQFHSYESPTVTPHSDEFGNPTSRSGLGSVLDRIGLNESKIRSMKDSMGNIDMRGGVDKARNYAQANPGKVLGGLAALVIGAGLMRGRR
jgi:hypothetical protein